MPNNRNSEINLDNFNTKITTEIEERCSELRQSVARIAGKQHILEDMMAALEAELSQVKVALSKKIDPQRREKLISKLNAIVNNMLKCLSIYSELEEPRYKYESDINDLIVKKFTLILNKEKVNKSSDDFFLLLKDLSSKQSDSEEIIKPEIDPDFEID